MAPLLALYLDGPDPLTIGPDRCRFDRPTPIVLVLWDGRRIVLSVIEAGFETDGLSRPGLLSWFVKRWGPERDKAYAHDWFLELMRRGALGGPKFLVDLLFLAFLVAGKTSFVRASLMFLAVRTRPAPKA